MLTVRYVGALWMVCTWVVVVVPVTVPGCSVTAPGVTGWSAVAVPVTGTVAAGAQELLAQEPVAHADPHEVDAQLVEQLLHEL